MRRLSITLFSLCLASALTAQTTGSNQSVRLRADNIDEVVSAMTLEEKVHLVIGCGMSMGSDTKFPGTAGRTYDIPRLGIPSAYLADGPHRLAMAAKREFDSRTYHAMEIPSSTTVAATFNPDAAHKVGRTLGMEVKDYGLDVLLAPGVNLMRNVLCGRNHEYYSEDPLLTGLCAAADTKGVQSYKGHGTTIKHFAANNQEDNRMFTNAHISERALREIYLKGFEIAVKTAQPYAIMTSYNLINGTHAANHYDMLQNVARDEWGFEGFIMTDRPPSQDLMALGMVSESGKYSYSDGVQCIKAGNDLQMPGCRKNVEDIVDGVKNGRITKADLQRCAKHILGIALKTI